MPRHPLAVSKRPEGQATRGKTARHRLRAVDTLIALYDPGLLRRRGAGFSGALCVDLGFGAEPHTTLESARRWRRLAPDLPFLGVEIDPERVEAAAPCADARTHFRRGGFNLPLRGPETVRLVRAMNVLRQYEASAVPGAYLTLARSVLPGGLLVEGTSDPSGRRLTAHLMRRLPDGHAEGPWRREALVFGVSFREEVEPVELQAVLPKDLIHRVVPGEPIEAFFAAWKAAVRDVRAFAAWGRRQRFAAVARRLAETPGGFLIDPRRRYLRRGLMVWRRPRLERTALKTP